MIGAPTKEVPKSIAKGGSARVWLITKHVSVLTFMLVLVLGIGGYVSYEAIQEQYWFSKEGVVRTARVTASSPIWISTTQSGRHLSGYRLSVPQLDGIDSLKSESDVRPGESVRYVVSPTLRHAEPLADGVALEGWLWHKLCSGDTVVCAFGLVCVLFAVYDQLNKAKRAIAGLPIDDESAQTVSPEIVRSPRIPLKKQFDESLSNISWWGFGLGGLMFFFGLPTAFLVQWLFPDILTALGISSKMLGILVFGASMMGITVGCWLEGFRKFALQDGEWSSLKGIVGTLGLILVMTIFCIGGFLGSFVPDDSGYGSLRPDIADIRNRW